MKYLQKLALIIISLIFACSPYANWVEEENYNPTPRDRIEQLIYLVEPEGIQTMLQTPESLYSAILDTFWYYQDPSPYTKRNEKRMTYYAKIDQCNRQFDGCCQEGYKTDRAKVYMIYGVPEDYTYSIPSTDMHNRTIWEYKGGRLKFIFVERYANCWVLLNPTLKIRRLNF